MRWLDAEGRAALGEVAVLLRKEGVRPDAVVASPLVRAVQTADILAAGVGFGGAIEALVALAPSGSAGHVADELPTRGASVMAVGHEPGMSALASHLSGVRFGGFRPGQVVCVDQGRAVWSLDPDALTIRRL